MKIILLTSLYVFTFTTMSSASENGKIILDEQTCKIHKCLFFADNKVISNYVSEDYMKEKENEALDEEDIQREEIEDMDNDFLEEIETDSESEKKDQVLEKKNKWWQFWK